VTSDAALLWAGLPLSVCAGTELSLLLGDVTPSAWVWVVTWGWGKDDKVSTGLCAGSVLELEECSDSAIALAISCMVLDCELSALVTVEAKELDGEVGTGRVLEVCCTLPVDRATEAWDFELASEEAWVDCSLFDTGEVAIVCETDDIRWTGICTLSVSGNTAEAPRVLWSAETSCEGIVAVLRVSDAPESLAAATLGSAHSTDTPILPKAFGRA